MFNHSLPVNDNDGNSVSCRIYAEDAVINENYADPIEKELACGSVGFHGDDNCGRPCENYCYFSQLNCMDGNKQYADTATCMTYCANMPDAPWNEMGDNVGCRLLNTFSAGLNPPFLRGEQCANGGPSGNNKCGSWCDVYCGLAMNNCQDANALYENYTVCNETCQMFNVSGHVNDASGDSVECRIYHLGVAGTSPANAAIHCPHGNATSFDGMCGGAIPEPTTTGPTTGATTAAETTTGATTDATTAATTTGATTTGATTAATTTGATGSTNTTAATTTGATTTGATTTGATTTASTTAKATTGNALALCVSVLLMLVVLF